MSFNNLLLKLLKMTKESQERGRQAEERVYTLAQTLGNARMATQGEDHAGKTDVVLEDYQIQVSVSPKSKKQRKRLEARGVTNIPGGEDVSDGVILTMLKKLIGLS